MRTDPHATDALELSSIASVEIAACSKCGAEADPFHAADECRAAQVLRADRIAKFAAAATPFEIEAELAGPDGDQLADHLEEHFPGRLEAIEAADNFVFFGRMAAGEIGEEFAGGVYDEVESNA